MNLSFQNILTNVIQVFYFNKIFPYSHPSTNENKKLPDKCSFTCAKTKKI